jgi:uncharacterized 2Fe-2S/4Fe-4S cluster protein (DUF4445 family)
MIKLTVHTDSAVLQLTATPGQSVRDLLDTTTFRVRAACGGSGTCGACVIRWLSGDVSPPTVAEYMKLSVEERDIGNRLACQLRLLGDEVHLHLEHPAPPSAWTSIAPQNLITINAGCPALTTHIYGVAVDLGTTHIRVALWDRKNGKRIATRHGVNPQADFGADVLNRLEAAQKHPEHALELARLARQAILHAVRDILARDVGEVSPMLAEIGEMLIVGNTAMLALLTGHGGPALIDPEHWQDAVEVQPTDRTHWAHDWALPNARLRLPAPVAGFVGSDLLADLIATRLTDSASGAMLLDVGTNTEIALWDGQHLHVTAVPGGPAFEGVGIRHGMAAETGAIFRVRNEAAQIVCETIGQQPAKGFCGSGLTDAIAVLLANGTIKPSGRFVHPPGPAGYALQADNPNSALCGIDIDAFQRAKAAIAAAMEILLLEAGMGWDDVQRLCICGAFGHTLHIEHAQALGLLPAGESLAIELFADASLAGCEIAMLSADGDAQFAALTENIKAINLSMAADYDDRFINHLRLRPIPVTRPITKP